MNIERAGTPSQLLAALFLLTALGCEHGTLEIEYADDDGVTVINTEEGASESDGSTNPGSTDEDGVSGPIARAPEGSGVSQDPEIAPLLHNVTFGERCAGGETVRYMVLSDQPSDCASDAGRIDTAVTAGELVRSAVVELDGTAQFQRTVQYCEVAGDCEDVEISFDLDDEGATLRGTWSGTLAGQQRAIDFAATSCAYDSALDPQMTDELATGISVGEVAVYQGVKIPIVAGGEVLSERNAPIVAGRPGVVRVFVEPQPDWEARDIAVRLTMGEIVKEQTFRPAAASIETDPQSTLNFELQPGELASGVSYSVEILEVAACRGRRTGAPGQR